jgi:hypothetical protein
MISWTETAPFAEASQSYSFSESYSSEYTTWLFGGTEPYQDETWSGSGGATISSGIDGAGESTYSKVESACSYVAQILRNQTLTGIVATSRETQRTERRTSNVDFGSTTEVVGSILGSTSNNWNFRTQFGEQTFFQGVTDLAANIISTFTPTTLTCQTTTVTTVGNVLKTTTQTDAARSTTGTTVSSTTSQKGSAFQTLTGTFPRTTTATRTKLSVYADSASTTRTTSTTYNGGRTGVLFGQSVTLSVPHKKITKYLLTRNEDVWQFTTTSAGLANLSQVASKLPTSGSVQEKTELASVFATTLPWEIVTIDGGEYLTQQAASWDQVTFTSTYSLWKTETSTLTSWALASNAAFGNRLGLPATSFTYTQTYQRQTTSTSEAVSSSFVSGLSQSSFATTTQSIGAFSRGQSYSTEYPTTTTVSADVPVAIVGSSSYSGFGGFTQLTITNGVTTTTIGADVSTEINSTYVSTEARASNVIKTQLFYQLTGGQVSVNETSFADGWAAPNAPSDVAFLVSAAGVSFPLNAIFSWQKPADLLSARPRINVPTLTSSSRSDQNGSTTFSVWGGGVTTRSQGSASDAQAVSSSGAWVTVGQAATSQNPFAFDPLAPTQTVVEGANTLSRYGGIPAEGSEVSAILPPGRYWTATGSSTGTTNVTTTTAVGGTGQTAAMFLPQIAHSELATGSPMAARYSVVPAAPYPSASFFESWNGSALGL